MKTCKLLGIVLALAGFLTSATAAPLESGITIQFITQRYYVDPNDPAGNQIEVQYVFPGDLLIFTGKSEEPLKCPEGGGYLVSAIVLDPTHERHPVLLTIVVEKPIPPGTRASVPTLPMLLPKLPLCRPLGYDRTMGAITN